MPKSCAARQCCNRYSNRRKQLTFHRFPFSRPELLKEWVLNIGRGNFEPKQHTVICSEHFRPECFSAFGNRKNLKHNAVPTVFAFQDARQPAGGTTRGGCEEEQTSSFLCLTVSPRLPHVGSRRLSPSPRSGSAEGALPDTFPLPLLLVREDTDPAGESGNADSEKEKVLPKAEAREHGLGRKTDTALEALQPPPGAGGPVGQVLPYRPEATEAPGQPASPPQPSDHSYALLDLEALKKKLFVTLKENEKLRKRLKAQRLVMQRLCSRLRAHRAGRPCPGAGPQPEQQS